MTGEQSRAGMEAALWGKLLAFAFVLLIPLRLVLRLTDLKMSMPTHVMILLGLTVVLRLVTAAVETEGKG